MKVAVIGSGGREHALVWRFHESPSVDEIYVIPGNPGMEQWATCVPLDYKESRHDLMDFLAVKGVELVLIGPEVPLVEGLSDDLRQSGFAVFGPSQKAAQLEGSKQFAKELMKKYSIPTAAYEVFQDSQLAKAYVEKMGAPIVIKADGLAAGKGVVVAQTVEEAKATIDFMLKEGAYGTTTLVIEECMMGEEASLLAFVDGERLVPMVAAQDHKCLLDGDEGPNTGGMGAYAPAPVMSHALRERALEEILKPMVQAMKEEGMPFVGCLYAGLMITAEGPKVVEFNVRFGDPETQVILPLLEGDLGEICYACAIGSLKEEMVRWKDESALCVIMASENYPTGSSPDTLIDGQLEPLEKSLVFHSGTVGEKTFSKGMNLYAHGGRVLGVVGLGQNLAEAKKVAYERVSTIYFKGMQYRKDIGDKGLR